MANGRLLAELEKLRVTLDRIDGRIEMILAQLNALEARLGDAGARRRAPRSRELSKRVH